MNLNSSRGGKPQVETINSYLFTKETGNIHRIDWVAFKCSVVTSSIYAKKWVACYTLASIPESAIISAKEEDNNDSDPPYTSIGPKRTGVPAPKPTVIPDPNTRVKIIKQIDTNKIDEQVGKISEQIGKNTKNSQKG